MYLSQQARQGGRERDVRLGTFLCDDWTAFGLDQLEWHGPERGRHGVESLTSAVCAFRWVLSYTLHTAAHSWWSSLHHGWNVRAIHYRNTNIAALRYFLKHVLVSL